MSDSSAPLITTNFIISGWDFDVESCTEAVGLFPNYVWHQKHAYLKQDPNIPNTNWGITHEKRKLRSLNQGLEELLATIFDKREQILDYTKNTGLQVGFSSFVYIYDDRPAYCLSAEVLGKVASFDAEYCFDVYDYRSDEV